MATKSKHYYLFSWRIWSIIEEVEIEAIEEVEEDEAETYTDHKLDGSQTLSAGDVPLFGFTPFTPHWITEEDE